MKAPTRPSSKADPRTTSSLDDDVAVAAPAAYLHHEALAAHRAKVVRDALLRDPGVPRELPLPDLRVPPQPLEEPALQLAQPDPVLRRRGPEVRGEEALVEAVALRKDEAARLEGAQVVRQGAVRQAQEVPDRREVRPGLRLDHAVDLAAEEVVEDLLPLDSRVEREDETEERVPPGLRRRYESHETRQDAEGKDLGSRVDRRRREPHDAHREGVDSLRRALEVRLREDSHGRRLPDVREEHGRGTSCLIRHDDVRGHGPRRRRQEDRHARAREAVDVRDREFNGDRPSGFREVERGSDANEDLRLPFAPFEACGAVRGDWGRCHEEKSCKERERECDEDDGASDGWLLPVPYIHAQALNPCGFRQDAPMASLPSM